MHDGAGSILLVEDEAIQALAEKSMLERLGYSVTIANTGPKAIEAVRSTGGIELILMDIDLGDGMDGTEAAHAILESDDIPIVFLSNHTEPEVVEKTERISSYGYIVKDSCETVIDASIKMAFKLAEAKKKAFDAGEHYRAIVENSTDFIMRYDRECRHIFANPAAIAATGLSLDRFVGKTHRELGFTDSLCRSWEEGIEAVFATGAAQSIEFDVELAWGPMTLQLNLSPEYDVHGSVHSVIGVSRDIGALKRTEESLYRYQGELQTQNDELRAKQAELEALRQRYFALYERGPIAYFTLNAEGGVLEANIKAADMLLARREELVRKPFSSHVFPPDQDEYYKFHRGLARDGSPTGRGCELRMRRRGGEAFLAHLSARMELDDGVCRVAVVELETREGEP